MPGINKLESNLTPLPHHGGLYTFLGIFKSWMFFSLRVGQEKRVIKEDIVEFMLGGVIVLDEFQRITYLNPSAARMLGKEKEQFLNQPIAETSSDLASHINAWTRKPKENNSRFETVILGGMILNSSLSFIEDWKGQITGRVMVLYDITDHVRMEKSLQIQANGLARLNHFTQALSQVSAKVAASAELDQVFQTLSVELRHLGLNFFIGLNRAGQAGYKIEFTSLSSDGLTQIENITGFGILGYLVPDLDDFLQYDATTIDRSIYFPHLMKSIGKILPLLPQGVDHPILNTIGIAPTSAGF